MDNLWSFLAAYNNEFTAVIVSAAVKTLFLFVFVALLCLVFRRLSSATRHLLWTSAICASLLLPFLSLVKIWEVPILPTAFSVSDAPAPIESKEFSQISKTSAVRVPHNLPASPEAGIDERKIYELQTGAESTKDISLSPNALEREAEQGKNATSFFTPLVKWFLIVWFTGMLLLLFKLIAGFVAANLLVRRAVQIKEPELIALFSSLLVKLKLKDKVRLLCSRQTAMPIVCGILRPAVILPAGAKFWSEERLRMVLLHELAHVARRDCLTQMLAQMACAFYWFNPLVWAVARRLRIEREQACDEYVLSIGTKASDYAHHLLEIARSMQEHTIFEWSQTTSVAMARKSQLEGRLIAILSKENKSRTVSRAVTVSCVALIGFLLVSLGAIRPTITKAQKSESPKLASDFEKNKTEKSLLDSLLGINTERENDSTNSNSKNEESAQKQGEASDDSIEQGVDDEQIDKDIDQSLKLDSANNLSKLISEDVEQQIAESLETPGMASPPAPEIDPIINVEFEPPGKPQTRNSSEDFIEEMASVGYTNLSIDELVNLKQADVTADYVRNLRALGFNNLIVKELASMGLHGVTPIYIQTIRAAGYNALSAKEITTFRIHDITPQYIKALRDAGYDNLNVKQLTDFAVHEVTPAFISGMRSVGFSNLTPKDIVSLRVHEITPEFVRKARSRLGELNLKQIISLKNAEIIEDDNDKE